MTPLTSSPTFVVGAAHHVGLVRANDEDAHLAGTHVLVVADGMGGHSAGDVASRLVVEEFARLADAVRTPAEVCAQVKGALAAAQARLRRYVDAQPEESGVRYAGTTVVAALRMTTDRGLAWCVSHLGDSRAYLLDPTLDPTRDGALRQVTRDHSVVEELVRQGLISESEAAVHPERHVVTRALGVRELPEVDVTVHPCGPGTRLVLCSDGASGVLGPEEFASLAAAGRPQEAADALVAAVLSAGAPDNVTVVVSDVV